MNSGKEQNITPQEAISLFSQLVEQTRLLPADYRKCQRAIAVLTQLAAPKPKPALNPEDPGEIPQA